MTARRPHAPPDGRERHAPPPANLALPSVPIRRTASPAMHILLAAACFCSARPLCWLLGARPAGRPPPRHPPTLPCHCDPAFGLLVPCGTACNEKVRSGGWWLLGSGTGMMELRQQAAAGWGGQRRAAGLPPLPGASCAAAAAQQALDLRVSAAEGCWQAVCGDGRGAGARWACCVEFPRAPALQGHRAATPITPALRDTPTFPIWAAAGPASAATGYWAAEHLPPAPTHHPCPPSNAA